MGEVIPYGGGPSTGLDQTAAGKITTGFESQDVVMDPEDREILRRLAERVAEISQSAEMSERRLLWHRLNTLQKSRPVVFCDPENGWNEIITESQMLCRGKLARRWEMDLRKEIFWGEEMGDDKPVEPYLVVPYTVQPDGSVSEVVVRDSGLEDPRAEACIAERVSWLWFPEPSGACTVTLEQRLDFDLPGLLAREADVAERVAEIKPGSILACGEKPDEEGAPTLVVKIHVVAGSVETATVPERYFVEEAVADCLVGQARGWTFDGVTEGRSVVHFRLEEPLVLPD